MGANRLFGFLCPIRLNNNSFCCQWTAYTISLPRCVCNIFSRLVKLISQPISVLLEDEGSEASSEGQDQRIVVFDLTLSPYKELVEFRGGGG